MLKGLLESIGINDAMKHDTMDRFNPSPYVALYFRHMLHLDQNKELKMFSVTHEIA